VEKQMAENRVVRIFVSSPSDVRPERLIAERVVKRLGREFSYHFELQAVLWEREPLVATHHFQDLILPPRETDIVVTVLWSRLGVPLPEAKYRGAISQAPVTGTEWEFEDAVAGYRLRGLPDLLLYRKRAKVTVELGDRAVLEEQQHQTELVEEFMRRWFLSLDGKSFVAASREFIDTTEFESMLEEHLRGLLSKRLTKPADIETPATINWHQGSPFRGLESFDLEHAAIFFGRMRARNDIREILTRQIAGGCGFVLVIGASGSGKSSLVKAGVLPDLLLPGMVGQVALCRYVVTRPGAMTEEAPKDALAALARSLFAETALPELAQAPLNYTGDNLRDIFDKAPASAAQPIRQGLSAAGQKAGLTERGEARLVLIVDQLEELFTAGIAQDVRERYVASLEALARSGLVWIIATMRSDFLDRVATLPALASLGAGEATYLLTPPDAADIGQIIRRPAREAGLTFEIDERAGRSLDEVIREAAARDPASLPLLEYLLDQLWHLRSADGVLTFQSYSALQGLEGAIGARAEQVLSAVPDAVRDAFPAVLRRLVTIGQGETAVATARLVPLATFPEASAERQLVDALIEPQARILVASGNGSASGVRVAHEALLTHWERARQQIAADRRDIRARVRLEEDEARWHEAPPADRDGLLLPRGRRLSEGEDLLARRRGELDPALIAFVESSARAVREADRLQLEAERRKVRQLRLVAVVVGVLAIGAAIGAGVSVYEGRAASAANKTVGTIQRLARHTSDPGTSPQRNLLLSLYAASLSKDVNGEKRLEAIDGLRQQLRLAGGHPLLGHDKPTRTAAFSSDGRRLATASEDGAIRLWNVDAIDPVGESVVLGSHNGPVHKLAFSPDGKWLVSSGEDGAIRLWSLTTSGERAGPVLATQPYGGVKAFAISPDGKWLAFGTADGKVCNWKLSADGATEAACADGRHENPVAQLMFSSKGRWLVTAAFGDVERQILLWDLSTQAEPTTPKILSCDRMQTEPALNAIAFSLDETRLAVACGYAADIWDLTQEKPPEHRVARGHHHQWVTAVAFSPDGKWLASGSINTDVKLWDLTGAHDVELDGREVVLGGHSATVRSVVFSDDGKWLATAGDDAMTYLWDLSGPRTIPATLLRGHDAAISQVVFSPGAEPRHLVTAGSDRYARLWTIPDSAADPIVLRGQQGKISATALSADGEWVASSGVKNPELLIWSIKDPRRPVKRLPLANYASQIAFSANGRWIAAAISGDSYIHLWSFPELSKMEIKLRNLAVAGPPSMGFSPDSRWLVSGAWNRPGSVTFWDVSGDTPSSQPSHRCQQGAPVRALGFDAGGRHAVTGEFGLKVHLWDLGAANPCESRRPLDNKATAIALAVSRDFGWIATANFQNEGHAAGRLWDIRNQSAPKLAAELSFDDNVFEASISSDNRWAAFGSGDKSVKVLDLRGSGAPRTAELIGHTGRVLSVAFSPDNRFLVTSGEDRTARVWDPENPREAPVVLRGHEGSVRLVGFSPDSRLLVTSGDDGTIMVWHLKLPDLIGIACRTAARQLTNKEVEDIIGDGQAPRPCTEELQPRATPSPK
jgi:WD40 repeat protein